MSDPIAEELLQLTHQLLNSIATGDWDTYKKLSDRSLTAFEPEAKGHLIEGLSFHQFYFKLGNPNKQSHTTIANPQVKIVGEIGIVTYVRIIQQVDTTGNPTTISFCETRIWHSLKGEWKQLHFHRSAA